MKILVSIVVCSLFFSSYSQVPLDELRDCHTKVKSDEEYAVELLQRFESMPSLNNVELGYWAVVEAMMAEHTYNPMKKLTYFNNGKDRLEKAINQELKNVELRYLRLGIQLNVPSFLGYKSAIEEDKKMIIQYISTQKKELGTLYFKIIDYLISSNICTETEKNTLKNLI